VNSVCCDRWLTLCSQAVGSVCPIGGAASAGSKARRSDSRREGGRPVLLRPEQHWQIDQVPCTWREERQGQVQLLSLHNVQGKAVLCSYPVPVSPLLFQLYCYLLQQDMHVKSSSVSTENFDVCRESVTEWVIIRCNRTIARIWVSWKPYNLQRKCIGHKVCIYLKDGYAGQNVSSWNICTDKF